MNILQTNKQRSNSIKFHSKFTQLTRKKQEINMCKQYNNDKRMISTKDTLRDQSTKQQQNQINWKQFQLIILKQIHNFKINKAKQISQIAIESEIKIPKIMKRIKNKLQNQIFEIIEKKVQNIQSIVELKNQINNIHNKSAQKLIRSPKQLGSTIQHTFTPKSIQTPGFDFQSTEQKEVNEFSLRSNQFTLGYQKQMSPGIGNNNIQQNVKKDKSESLVSQFSLAQGSRNPTSKRIKQKIMNSRKNF